jgi:metal-responsive CopG/Arc/MetJ family transcriptional regulator
MKTAVSIPDQLFKAADKLAKELGTSRSDLYARALKAFVDERSSSAVTHALNAVYGEQPSELDAVLAALQWASLPREDW